MSEKIKTGDHAVIKWDKVPEEQDILILNMPQGEGDLIQIEYLNGVVQAFSPIRTDYILGKKPI